MDWSLIALVITIFSGIITIVSGFVMPVIKHVIKPLKWESNSINKIVNNIDIFIFVSMIPFFIVFIVFSIMVVFIPMDMPFFYLNFYNIGILGNLYWFFLTWMRIYFYEDCFGNFKKQLIFLLICDIIIGLCCYFFVNLMILIGWFTLCIVLLIFIVLGNVTPKID
ncbi:MAG: hypothetical protein EGP82_00220 [Odoribacter splanchnicus]|nr:hypothetical protein [Odoribacter splanchnicus]